MTAINFSFLIFLFLFGGQPTGTLSVRVVTDVGDAPVRLAYVLVVGERGERRLAMTDMEGHATVGELPPGRYTVGAGKAPHVSVTTNATVEAGATSAVALRVLPGAVITGVVVNEDGTPASGRDVTARLNGQPDTLTVMTNSAGEYRLFGLVAGTWTISLPRQTVTTEATVGTGESVTARALTLPANPQAPRPALPGRTPVQPGDGTIGGVARDAVTGTPLSGVTISLNSNQRTIATDSNGRFEFRGLAPATYSLSVRHTGFGPTQNADVPLTAGATITDVELRAGRFGSLAGVVRDAVGDPVAGVSVRSLQIRANDALLGIMPRGAVVTDDRGMFNIGNLPPSEYLLCACPVKQHPVDPRLLRALSLSAADFNALASSAGSHIRVSPPTFFPGSTRMADSVRLHVPFGDDRLGIDITMPHVPAFTVSGRITANGQPPSPMPQLMLVPDGDSGLGMGLVEIAAPPTKADGTFLVPGVPAGRYTAFTIRESRPSTTGATSPGTFLTGAVPVDATQGDVTGLEINLHAGATVRGRIQFSGSSAEPTNDELAKAGISLAPAEITLEILSRIGMAGGIGQRASINPDRTFELQDVPRGRYWVIPHMPGTRWTAERVVSADVVEADTVLTVAHNGTIDAVVTLGDTVRGSLLATVELGKYEPPGTIRVVLFPVDASTWDHPLRSLRMFQSAMRRIDGAFSITDIPEGEYYVARDSSLTADLGMSAIRLRQLAPTAHRVTIRNGQTTTVVVRR